MISGRRIEDWGDGELGGGSAEISLCCPQPSKFLLSCSSSPPFRAKMLYFILFFKKEGLPKELKYHNFRELMEGFCEIM